MARSNELAKVIADAAKAHLQPIGCQRVRQSRLWISDQRYWLIVIEFQPSAWEKGSYLNVGAMWLWRARKGFAFHVGYRIGDFVSYYDPEQFTPHALRFAAQAAEEVQRLRKQFKSLPDICQYLLEHTPESSWHIFHPAIAAGLVGEIETAQRLFQLYAEKPTQGEQRELELRARYAALASQLDQPSLFRSSVEAIIQECRVLNGLPPDPGCLDGEQLPVNPL
jgi:hypothetical protein